MRLIANVLSSHRSVEWRWNVHSTYFSHSRASIEESSECGGREEVFCDSCSSTNNVFAQRERLLVLARKETPPIKWSSQTCTARERWQLELLNWNNVFSARRLWITAIVFLLIENSSRHSETDEYTEARAKEQYYVRRMTKSNDNVDCVSFMGTLFWKHWKTIHPFFSYTLSMNVVQWSKLK